MVFDIKERIPLSCVWSVRRVGPFWCPLSSSFCYFSLTRSLLRSFVRPRLSGRKIEPWKEAREEGDGDLGEGGSWLSGRAAQLISGPKRETRNRERKEERELGA